jgi:heme oxygenase
VRPPATCPTLRFRLRARVAALHARLDQAIEAACFGEALDLGRFLSIHHAALTSIVPALEHAGAGLILAGWEGRSRLLALEADLAELRARPMVDAGGRVAFAGEQEVWGALYALEGSWLGNRALLQRVVERGSPLGRGATRFLAYGSGDGMAWRRFVVQLDALDYRGAPFEAAALGAERVFGAYLAAVGRHAPGAGGVGRQEAG